MHEPIREQYKTLCSKLRDFFYQYFGIRSNFKALEKAYYFVLHAWAKWLSRRSSKGKMHYDDLKNKYPLPQPLIVHSI